MSNASDVLLWSGLHRISIPFQTSLREHRITHLSYVAIPFKWKPDCMLPIQIIIPLSTATINTMDPNHKPSTSYSLSLSLPLSKWLHYLFMICPQRKEQILCVLEEDALQNTGQYQTSPWRHIPSDYQQEQSVSECIRYVLSLQYRTAILRICPFSFNVNR